SRADSLLIGCITATMWHGNKIRSGTKTIYFLVAVATITALAALRPQLRMALPLGLYSLLAVSCASVIVKLLDTKFAGELPKSISPLVYTGRISYGMDLWHFPIYSIVVPLLFSWRMSPFVSLVVLFVLVFMVALL